MNEKMLFGIKPPQHNPGPIYTQYSGDQRFLSPPECDAIVNFMSASELRLGTVGLQRKINTESRIVYTASLPVEPFQWLYDRLLQRMSWVNDAYKYNLSGLAEPIQYLEYREPEGEIPAGHYTWHTDTGSGIASIRKLSCVIQLSNPWEYEGCRLTLFDCVTPEAQISEIGQGDMVVFPSFTPHCVTPLTRGIRRSLAIWVSGPPFA